MKQTGRKLFQHEVPSWVDPDASDFFITICCQKRGLNQLCRPEIGTLLLKTVRFYHDAHKWHPALFLLMPDHLHMIVSFGRDQTVEGTVSAWNRFAATKFGIVWQRGFFEHRLRRDESWEEKADYILQNPVRAGLMKADDDETWPYLLMTRD